MPGTSIQRSVILSLSKNQFRLPLCDLCAFARNLFSKGLVILSLSKDQFRRLRETRLKQKKALSLQVPSS